MEEAKFELNHEFIPAGDQPQAIDKLFVGLERGYNDQTLLGVTGSGKTFTVSNVIERANRPTLVLAHNKTLAAQLAQEFRTFFPKNAVEYFVSYYDYYQPEAYIKSTDTYIEKETQINEEIDRLRHSATAALLSRRDVIVVASVSCIYGLGTPEWYQDISLEVSVGSTLDRKKTLEHLVAMYYSRSDILARGRFRVRGDVIEIMAPGKEIITRIDLTNGQVQSIIEYDGLTGEKLSQLGKTYIYPAKHFVVPEPIMDEALTKIQAEMEERVKFFEDNHMPLEAERIHQRTRQDIEMIREVGYCQGIENYSRHLTGRKAGEPPATLIDYFPDDYLLVIDESHVTIPQVGGMYNGDRARKVSLVDNGFRLPSAVDNRPLKFEEFRERMGVTIYVSATPAEFELKHSKQVVEQIIRPTGLVDPEIEVRSAKTQVKDLFEEIRTVLNRKERVLVTTLTKKMAEDLAEYLKEHEIQAEYLHSNVETLDRIKILEKLRRGDIEVLVGVNLLREGLDLPEVSLVAILDADKEGFLRSETSLIQTMGRAARNVLGKVILYADKITGSMERAIKETERRRELQIAHNIEHNITPQSIKKKIQSIVDHELSPELPQESVRITGAVELRKYIKAKEKEMKEAARELRFEHAAIIRDELHQLRKMERETSGNS